jgi:anti-sigma factor RsiW
MNCHQFTETLDEYLGGELPHAEHVAASTHAHSCSGCQRRLARRHALRSALREMPVQERRPEFFERTLQHAYRSHPHWRQSYAIGAGLAAALALWIGFGWLPGPTHAPSNSLASVTISLDQPRTVQIAFNAEHALEQAMLDITLPAGVELEGYPGQRQIRWQTDLSRGVNVLSLPLIAVSSSGGTLLARLEHGERSTELAVQLRVNNSSRTSAPKIPGVINARV